MNSEFNGLRQSNESLYYAGTALSDEERQKLSTHTPLVQEIYESKCLHPSEEDILNCVYGLEHGGLASLIHQHWNGDDVTFGHQIRERFKQDFLEVSHIEALEKIEH